MDNVAYTCNIFSGIALLTSGGDNEIVIWSSKYCVKEATRRDACKIVGTFKKFKPGETRGGLARLLVFINSNAHNLVALKW